LLKTAAVADGASLAVHRSLLRHRYPSGVGDVRGSQRFFANPMGPLRSSGSLRFESNSKGTFGGGLIWVDGTNKHWLRYSAHPSKWSKFP